MVVTRVSRDPCSCATLPITGCSILHLSRPMNKLCTSSLFSISLAEFYSSNNLKLTSFSNSSCDKQNLIFESASVFRTLDIQQLIFSVLCASIIIKGFLTKVCHWMEPMKGSQENVVSPQTAPAVAAAVPAATFPTMPLTHRCLLPQTGDMVG